MNRIYKAKHHFVRLVRTLIGCYLSILLEMCLLVTDVCMLSDIFSWGLMTHFITRMKYNYESGRISCLLIIKLNCLIGKQFLEVIKYKNEIDDVGNPVFANLHNSIHRESYHEFEWLISEYVSIVIIQSIVFNIILTVGDFRASLTEILRNIRQIQKRFMTCWIECSSFVLS